jgi:eukaryotic-like serine/threonine-protein kinase
MVGQTLIGDRYNLREPLGRGGIADVFLAHHEVLERDLALKILREQYTGGEVIEWDRTSVQTPPASR